MSLKILFFSSIAEVTKTEAIELDNVSNTTTLISVLAEKFPGIEKLQYVIALNKVITHENELLKDNDVIAFLPPFSGG